MAVARSLEPPWRFRFGPPRHVTPPGGSTVQAALHGDLVEAQVAGEHSLEDLSQREVGEPFERDEPQHPDL